jgi:hypothetical protein
MHLPIPELALNAGELHPPAIVANAHGHVAQGVGGQGQPAAAQGHIEVHAGRDDVAAQRGGNAAAGGQAARLAASGARHQRVAGHRPHDFAQLADVELIDFKAAFNSGGRMLARKKIQ